MSKTVLNDGDEGVVLIVKDFRIKPTKPRETRSPVHVLYGGADRFNSATPAKMGKIALASLNTYVSNFAELTDAMGMKEVEPASRNSKTFTDLENKLATKPQDVKNDDFSAWFAWTVYHRVLKKLKTEPIEDFRIDFEDGYGYRSDAEEDAHAIEASAELAKAFLDKTITAFSGLRIKSFAPETFGRGVRTLNLFLGNFLKCTGGKLPDNFVVTLPKITERDEVRQLCRSLDKIEKRVRLKSGSIKVELMIETPQSIVDKKGRIALAGLVKAAKGRCTSAHFGAFDYTASLGIASSHQHLRHEACNFARQMMLATLSPLGIRLSDSVTTEIPVAIHKGDKLTKIQFEENKKGVHAAWRTHFDNVTQSMSGGFYQSWDLHPNQLVARYAAVYAFFLETMDAQADRLKAFIAKATQASLTGNTFDDAASARGLINFFARAVDCGALTDIEVGAATGLGINQLFQLLPASDEKA